MKELLRYGVSVYSVAVSSAYFERRFSRLVDYAHDTGGDVYFAAKRTTMEELYSRVTEASAESIHAGVFAVGNQPGAGLSFH